jgi:hypothetical protein
MNARASARGKRRGIASHQETSVQKSNPSPNLSSVPFPFCLSEALASAYARAREASPGAAPSASDIFGAYARGNIPEQPSGASDGPGDDAGAVDGKVDIAELLGVMRAPIAWVFTLAERRAEDDPVDLAAIQRVRDAALHRVDAVIAGAAAADAPRIRAADVLTVASLLVGTLDPAIFQHAAQLVGSGLTDALSALLPLAPAIASEFASPPCVSGAPNGHNPVAPPWYGDYLAHAAVPFVGVHGRPLGSPHVAGPYGGPLGHPHVAGPYGGPLAGSPVLHVAVPPGHWLHSLFAF